MKLDAFERSGARRPVYSARLSDEDGNSHYELSITGPQKLIETAFAKSDIEVEIAPRVTSEQFNERSQQFWNKRFGPHSPPAPPIQTVASLMGKRYKPPAPDKDSVLVYLRRTEGKGTFWGIWVPSLVLPPRVTMFFFLPRVWATWSGVVPFTGNPNLFMNVTPPPSPPVSTAVLGGPIAEAVSYATIPFPWSQFPAWHIVSNAVSAYTVTHYALVAHSVSLF